MIYAYDILLNFSDENRVIDFYEWSINDDIEHIKKIPLFYIETDILKDLFNNKIKVDASFLDKIRDKTISYRKGSYLKYCSLFTDQKRVLAIEFNDRGESISRSSLQLDEEEDIIEETSMAKISTIKYSIITKDKDIFLTRLDMLRKKYLLCEFKQIGKNKEKDKFNYLYEEIYDKDQLSFDKRLTKILDDLNNNYTAKYNELYKLLRLINAKK